MTSPHHRLALSLALAVSLLVGGLLALRVVAAPLAPAADALAADARAVEAAPQVGRLVLAVPPGAAESSVRELAARGGAALDRWLSRLGLALVRVPAGQEAHAAQLLAAQPGVDFVTAYRKSVSIADVPLDEYYPQQWGMARVSGPAAWDLAWSDPSVVIAVVDTGVNYLQWDLRDRTWFNPGESGIDPATGGRTCADPLAFNGADDDGNGYVDDCRGYDFAARDNDPRDGNGHGTAVAGIAAATTNNFIYGRYEGVAGMARQASLMALRVLDDYGLGYPFNIAEAIDYAAQNGAAVINLSLTLPQNANPADVEQMRRAVASAQVAGVVVVGASGNQSYSTISYPAAFVDVLAVGASTPADLRASFSNYGDRLDLVAPGTGIVSTLMAGTHSYGLYNNTGNGTSFASPHVAGVAALVRGLRPDLGQADVRELIRRTADDIDAAGWDRYTGWGRLNARAALAEAVAGLRINVEAAPAGVPVGADTTIYMQILASAPSNEPAGRGARVALTASAGAITPTLVTVDSAGRATARFTVPMMMGTARITATLGSVSATLPVSVTSGIPATLTLQAAPARIPSGGAQATITVTVRDEGGNAVLAGTPVLFTTTLGRLDPLVAPTTAGIATTVLTSGVVSGTAQVQATTAAITGVVPVEIVGAGQPFSITLTATPAAIVVAGAPATITATVFDGMGALVADGTPVHFATDRGALAAADTTTIGGLASVLLSPGIVPGPARVTAQAGAAAGETMVTVLPGLAAAVAMTATPSQLTAGHNQTATVAAIATDAYGNRVTDGTRLDFAASLGIVSPAWTATTNGLGAVNLVGELVAGTSFVTVTAAGGAQGYVQVRIRPAAPARIANIAANPAQIAVGGAAARLNVRVEDSFGNAVADGTAVTLTTDLGALRPATTQAAALAGAAADLVATTANGVALADLVSDQTAGTAHVRAAVASNLSAATYVTILAGPPASLTLAVEPTQIPVGGRARLTATAVDAYGNRVADGVVVRFGANRGLLDPAEAATNGGVAATWLTVRSGVGPVSLVALSGSASAFGSLEVVAGRWYLPVVWR